MTFAQRGFGVGLPWLVRLRWLTVAAQGLAVLTAGWMGRISSSGWAFAVLCAMALSNAALHRIRRDARRQVLIGPILVLDVVLLTILLHCTGGPMNPFSALYFVHITLAAVLLAGRWVLLVLFSSLAGFGLLFALPSETPPMHPHGDLSAHLRGMWLAFAVSASLIAYFVSRLTHELARREEELAVERDRTARSRRAAALSGLAAGAAHELGTPIGSIALAAGELERVLGEGAPAEIRDDVRLIRHEVGRCREILDSLAIDAGDIPGEGLASTGLHEILGAAVERLGTEEARRVRLEGPDAPVRAPRTALALAVASLLRNALEADAGPIDLETEVENDRVMVEIRDRGRGMSAEVLSRADEPFFTTKADGSGMGLGLFLARALAEQLGGSLTLESAPARGTTARLTLPRVGAGGRA